MIMGESVFISVKSRWRHIGQKLAKKQGQCPAILTEQAWSVKDLFHGFRGNSGQSESVSQSHRTEDLVYLARSQSQPYDK